MTVEILLGNDFIAIIDDEDADLALLRWYPLRGRSTVYAQQPDVKEGKQETRLLHRVIMERIVGRKLLRSEHVDHVHNNGLDNRRSEIRLASPGQNKQHQGLRKDNTSGFKGVSWHKHKKKWCAAIHVNHKKKHLGYFDTREEAHEAYKKAAPEHHGEFARFE